MPKFFRKSLFLIIILVWFSFFVPSLVQAADSRCWQKEACEADHGVFYPSNAETVRACKTAVDGAKKEIGFCTAVGPAVTQVGFGGEGEGRRTFENFGKFIQWIYRYGIMIAGVLAMVMLVVAGLQWVTSAGSPERITSARKRIGNALMGLFVAVVSYFILNTVNPYLVNLRLPQVWKINTIGLVMPYCDEVKDKKLSETQNGQFTIEPKDAKCGKEYFVDGGGDITCKGTGCDGRKGCVPFTVSGGQKVDQGYCSEDLLTIYFKADSSATSMFSEDNTIEHVFGTVTSFMFKNVNMPNWLLEDPSLVLLCENGTKAYVDGWWELPPSNVKYEVISKDKKGDDLKYHEYLVKYNSTSLINVINGRYKCKESFGGGNPTAFYLSDNLDIDVKFGDYRVYIASISNTRDKLTAARYGGSTNESWPLLLSIFKNKNHFFQLSVTAGMLENIAWDASEKSVPKLGGLGSGFTFSFADVKNYWLDLIF